MSKQKILYFLSSIINVIVVVLVFYAWATMFIGDGTSNLSAAGLGSLRYFTVLSNIFCGITSFLLLVFKVVGIIKKDYKTPSFSHILQFASTVGVLITFLVVLTMLAPFSAKNGGSYFDCFKGANLYFHFIIPVLAIVDYIVLEHTNYLHFKDIPYCIIPVFLYGIFYIANYYCKWTGSATGESAITYDWYGFIGDGSALRVTLLIIVFLIGTYIIGLLLRELNVIFQKKVYKIKKH